MEKKGIDVLLNYRSGKYELFVGYNAWSFYIKLVVTLNDEMPYFIGHFPWMLSVASKNYLA